jgi:hypothetical protein
LGRERISAGGLTLDKITESIKVPLQLPGDNVAHDAWFHDGRKHTRQLIADAELDGGPIFA